VWAGTILGGGGGVGVAGGVDEVTSQLKDSS
jgi:hypothetical protein